MIIVHLKTEYMSNLCQEITLPTTPIQHIDGRGSMRLHCVFYQQLTNKMSSKEMMEEYCDLTSKSLEELIDHQNYPVDAAKRSTVARRSLTLSILT